MVIFGKNSLRPRIRTKRFPGPRTYATLASLKKINGGWYNPVPVVLSGVGHGCFFEDIDRNRYLDFGSQIASNPLGYNHPRLLNVLRRYHRVPIKVAGQDYIVHEHYDLLKTLLRITPGMNAGFLINSGAEATENAIKCALYLKKTAKFGVSFQGAFHGRTLGALSCTNAKSIHKHHYFTFPMHRLPFSETMKPAFERLLEQEAAAEDIGFVIIEPVQGEGGYHIALKDMMRDLSSLSKKYRVPLIVDEVQTGIGRSGKWWAYQHYDFRPSIIACAKALQVGAVVARKEYFPSEPGAISTTWGGGQVLDMALGIETIQIIKDEKLLPHVTKMGKYLVQRLHEIDVFQPRGLGLLCAFDLETKALRNNVVLEAVKHGLVVLGCGERSVRVIPPYIVTEKEIDTAIEILDTSVRNCRRKGFQHKGKSCKITTC